MRNLFCLFLGVVLAIACTHKEFYSFTNEKNLEMISVKIDEILLADFMIKERELFVHDQYPIGFYGLFVCFT